MHNLLRNLRFAFRQLRKSPGFTLTTVLTLALGIGALTTVATWTNAVLYNPWPHVLQPRGLRFISATVLGGDGYTVGYDQFTFLREQGRSFEDSAAFSLEKMSFAAPGMQPQALIAGTVSSNYFKLLGMQPQLGQLFQPGQDDHQYGSNDQVVLSNDFWREQLGSDPKVVGRPVSINGHVFAIAGVAPAGFAGTYGGIAESMWVPLSSLRDLISDPAPDPLKDYGLMVAVRLRPGVKDETAVTEIHTLARSYANRQHDSKYNGWNLNLDDSAHFQRGLFGVVGQMLPILLGASLLLMLLVCINIASLLGQHAARRRREVAIRTALGAAPKTIAAQVLTETGLLAALGGVAGWAMSLGMSKAIFALLSNFGFLLAFNLHTDARILMFVSGVVIAVTLVCGIFPARQSLRTSQNEVLHEGGAAVAGASRSRLMQRLLVGLQLGLCFIVLVSCGLLTRTAFNTVKRDPGFDMRNCLTASIDLSRSGYNQQRGLALQSALLERLRSDPGVVGATITTHLPMGDSGSGNTQDFKIPGYVPAKSEAMQVVTDFEGPEYFQTVRIPLLQGRDFTVHDDASSPGVAIINESMAHRYWPNGDALGHSVVVGKKTSQIVGVVRDYAYHDPQMTDSLPILFLPLAQNYSPSFYIAMRTRTPGPAVVSQLRQAVGELDSSLPLEDVQTLEEVAGFRYMFARIPAELIGVYALSSILVAMLGLYAVMAYSVIERHREFALRMALGSTRAGIFRLVLAGTEVTAGFGLLTGGLGSLAAMRLLRSLLFGVTPFDPISYCAAAGFLLLTVFVAGLSPARRAASIEPMRALRSE